MTDSSECNDRDVARGVFAGLVPHIHDHAVGRGESRTGIAKGMMSTMPILLAGSMAVALNLTGPISTASAKPSLKPRGSVAEPGKTLRESMAAHGTAKAPTVAARATSGAPPMSYRVVVGDTVSEVAERFGLSTVSVLTLNGLSWSSLIFPGQELLLTKSGPTPSMKPDATESNSSGYTVSSGDTVSAIAERLGVSTLSVLTANGLGWSSIIYPGQILAIPGFTETPASPTAEPDSDSRTGSIAEDEPPVHEPARPETTVDAVAAEPAPIVVPLEPPAAQVKPPVPPPTPVAPAPPAAGGRYTVRSGDTLSGIATTYGIATQALLDANGLSRQSVIYPGNVLVIPGSATPAPAGGSATTLSAEMRTNAATIIQVGRDLGVPDYGIVIALATAMQESSLRNINWGDRDSVGLFQQRPSSGWGTVDQLTSPNYAARLFYGGPSNPNVGRTRGLLDIAGWQSMSLTRAAQAVQISGYPDAYAKWESDARSWFAQLG